MHETNIKQQVTMLQHLIIQIIVYFVNLFELQLVKVQNCDQTNKENMNKEQNYFIN